MSSTTALSILALTCLTRTPMHAQLPGSGGDTTLIGFQRRFAQAATLRSLSTFVAVRPQSNKLRIAGASVDVASAAPIINNAFNDAVRDAAIATSAYLAGLQLGIATAAVENDFQIKSSVWQIPEIRGGFDWVNTAADATMTILGTIALVQGHTATTNGSSGSNAVSLAGGGLAIGGLAKLVLGLLQPTHQQRIQQLTSEISISRSAYDDALIRSKSYDAYVTRLNDVRTSLDKDLTVLANNGATAADKEQSVRDVLRLGHEVSEAGQAMRAILIAMQQQADHYATASSPYIGEVQTGYQHLKITVDALVDQFDKTHAARFRLIDETVTELAAADRALTAGP